MNAYHGIIINLSQKDKSIFRKLKVIGKKKILLGLITIYKVEIPAHELETAIAAMQANMPERIFFRLVQFYFHIYRDAELIVVFKQRQFRTSTDKTTWQEVIAYGRSLGISKKQLDFFPCRIEEETY